MEVNQNEVVKKPYRTVKLRPVKMIKQVDKEGRMVNKFSTIEEAAEHTKIAKANILCALQGKRAATCGYRWYYVDSE